MRPNVDSCAARVKGLRQPPRCPSQEWDRNAPGRYPNCRRRLLGARFLALTVAFGGSRGVSPGLAFALQPDWSRLLRRGESLVGRSEARHEMADQGNWRDKRR